MPSGDRQQAMPAGDFLIHIRGTVQGVGFRPFIARLADEHRLSGWVRNDADGVTVRVLCSRKKAEAFAAAIPRKSPPAADVESVCVVDYSLHKKGLPPAGHGSFSITGSPEQDERPTVAVTPDLALCEDCRHELLDPRNRRYGYPFINCTNCGPRYSIVLELPYDREHTTMAGFRMCPDCAREYADPLDRRYHAQPNACPVCGPSVKLSGVDGTPLEEKEAAIEKAAAAIREGHIVAVKGIGGYHLFADALADGTVGRLRQRKHRDEKPLAVMFPSVEVLREFTEATAGEIRLMESPAAPIVLVKQRQSPTISPVVAPGNPLVGALLPYTPLHVILMDKVSQPVVATSANLSEEPLCKDDDEAFSRLTGIADLVLSHNRPIARPVDDSVQRVTSHGTILLRRARGYAPGPLLLPEGMEIPDTVMCMGSHLKNTVAIARGRQVILSPHVGDLSNSLAIEASRDTVALLSDLYGGAFERVACDLHPDYASTRMAESAGLPVVRVQHHLAHVLACLLEHGGGPGKVLGVSWDGTGYGEDRTIWGGEFILVDREEAMARRVGHLRPFRLPGGEEAIRRTGRCAIGALHSAGLLENGEFEALLPGILGKDYEKRLLLSQILRQELNAPVTTSAGRLFDAAAAILGIAGMNHFEGQAGMAMEFAATGQPTQAGPYPFGISPANGSLQADWSPMLGELCRDRLAGKDPAEASMRFHKTLVEMIVAVARECGIECIVLTGGCFQNALLSDLCRNRLAGAGFKVLRHQKLPPNDNAIAAGQAMAVALGLTSTAESPWT